MRRYRLKWIALGIFVLQGGWAIAQNSLDALEEELKEAKQEHQDLSAQALSNFFGQIDAAMASPEAAVALYQQAGGTLPEATPVVTDHVNETATEKEARLAQDAANSARLGAILQLHCGLMHYAALFVVKPDQKGLQEEWVAWLQKAAQAYPQVGLPAANVDREPAPARKKKNKEDAAATPDRPTPFNPADLKAKTMHDSIISKYLGFKSWGDKEQGGWAVAGLPALYRTNVLDPLRKSPTPATLVAWDAYIGMMNADEKDNDRWNQVVYPPLQFDRASDDYAIAPGTEKLEGLVNLIKANPTFPQADDWISRVHKLMDDYRAQHGGVATDTPNPAVPAPSAPATDPHVTVTTVQQGDMTIITTHTNSAPVNGPAPH